MKYTPLDNIGLPTRKEDGTLSTILAPGNNYPANEVGIPKSEFVRTEENNIILRGIYDENEVKYPLIDPVVYGVTSVPNTTFRFLIKDISSTNLYASEEMYNDLISAYEERNPWFTVTTVPTINLDIKYLSDYHKVNKFTITQLYTETEVTSTLDTDEEILQYIDWLVKPSVDILNINLKPTEELGTWAFNEDGQIGLGYKNIYESMTKDKEPDPEAIGEIPISETYDLSLPPITQVDVAFQSLPEEEIVPKLIDAIMSVRKPPGQPEYNPFDGGVAKWLLGAAAVAITLATAGAAAPLLALLGTTAAAVSTAGAVAGLAAGAAAALATIERKSDGSYIKYILARHQDRAAFERKSKVFERERKADQDDWNALLGAAKQQMGVTRVTKEHVKSALQVIFMNFGNTKWQSLSYTMQVGWPSPTTATYTLNVTSAFVIKVELKY